LADVFWHSSGLTANNGNYIIVKRRLQVVVMKKRNFVVEIYIKLWYAYINVIRKRCKYETEQMGLKIYGND